MRNLLQLDREFVALLALIENGEATEEAIAALEQHEQDLAAKGEGYIGVIRSIEQEAKTHQALATYHADKVTGLSGRASWLRGRLEAAMRLRKLDKLKTVHGTASLRTGHAKMCGVVIEDPAAIPREWFRPVEQPEPDKARIKAALLAGQPVPGAKLADAPTWMELK